MKGPGLRIALVGGRVHMGVVSYSAAEEAIWSAVEAAQEAELESFP